MTISLAISAALAAANFSPAEPTPSGLHPPSGFCTIPDGVRVMIENALASGNESDIRTVVRIAKASHPAASREIDQLIQPWEEKKRREQHALASVERNLVRWTGQGQLGGFRSTGTVNETGLAASVSLKRQGPRWTHLFRARADYRRTEGRTSRESVTVAYEPRLQLSPRAFTYGLAQFERAPYLGFSERYTLSAGFGSKLVQTKSATFSIDTGPSLRSTDLIGQGIENRFGWRASSDLDWKLSSNLTIRQDTNAYVETEMQTVNGLFAMDTKIISRLSARLSYDVRYESSTDARERRLDTMSKVTLVYDF